MEHLSSRIIFPQDFNYKLNELQFTFKNNDYPNLSKFVSICSKVCPKSGTVIINEQLISTLKHIESKGFIHTFEMWESPYFLPHALLSKHSICLSFKYVSDNIMSFGFNFDDVLNNSTSMFIKIYYQDEHDFLLKFVPNKEHPVNVEFKQGELNIIKTTHLLIPN